MKTFVGLIIIIISISIITLQFWYYHFYMVGFGDGIAEAPLSQRAIATLITSLPSAAFIYLAFKYLIFESHLKNLPVVTKKWPLLAIAFAYFNFSIVWFPVSNVIMGIVFYQRMSETSCYTMVTDAQNTAASIYDSYSDSDNTTLPSVTQLIQGVYLSTDLPVTIEAGADGEAIVTVVDDNAKCPNREKYIFYLNGMEPEWKD